MCVAKPRDDVVCKANAPVMERSKSGNLAEYLARASVRVFPAIEIPGRRKKHGATCRLKLFDTPAPLLRPENAINCPNGEPTTLSSPRPFVPPGRGRKFSAFHQRRIREVCFTLLRPLGRPTLFSADAFVPASRSWTAAVHVVAILRPCTRRSGRKNAAVQSAKDFGKRGVSVTQMHDATSNDTR